MGFNEYRTGIPNQPEIRDMIHKVNGFDPSVETQSLFDFQTQLRLKLAEVSIPERPLTPDRVELVTDLIAADFETVVSDLKTFDLAKGHAKRLVDHLVENGAKTEKDILVGGAIEFHNVAQYSLGPVWASYVNEVLSSGKGGGNISFCRSRFNAYVLGSKGHDPGRSTPLYACRFKVCSRRLE